jgi:hypothetical protein
MAKQTRGKRSGKPARRPAGPNTPEAPPELRAVIEEVKRVAEDRPDMVAQVFKDHPELEVEVILPFLVRSLGREALPLLRGAALDEDASLALAALRSLPLLGTRAAGEALAAAYAAYPEGERARLAWEGVEALRAQGINVTVPEPEGVRRKVAAFELRETLESFADSVGSYATYARGQDAYGLWQTVGVIWNDQAGVKEGFRHAIGRREWERFVAGGEEEGVVLIRVPPEFARWQVERVRRLNEQTGFPLGENLEPWNAALGPAPAGYEPPDPLARFRALSREARTELTREIHLLLDRDGFQGWALNPAECRPWLDEWNALDERQFAAGENAEAAADALLAGVVRELVTPELREKYRERLTDAARKLEWLGDEDHHEIAAAVALEIEEPGAPEEIMFFLDLAHRGLTMLHEILEEGEDPESYRYDPLQAVEKEE